MAGASDKARFYLEKSVPELKELQRKDVFSKVSPSPRKPLLPRALNVFVGRSYLHRQETLRFRA